MRFSSFLPMLLLVGALHAQNQCSIFDLTAKVANYAPSTCQYYVVLDFEHTGTTNQFTVTGNGNNYGTFNYGQVPLTLGPFTAGSTPAVKEFVVTDAVFTDCKDDAQTDVPGCQTSTDCDIYDVKVIPGDCVPGSLTYQLTLNFQVKNPGNDFFEVWAGNGQYLGVFPLSQLPLNIPNFPWDGDPTDHIKICINDNPDCCETVSFPAPDCLQGPCSISGLTVETGDCTSDSTYKVEINFAINTPNIVGVFGLWANGSFIGIFGLNDLPLTLDSFPWNGGPADEIKVCIVNTPTDLNNLQILCCKTLEFQVPGCLPVYPCGIKDMKVETDTCSSDSTFGLWVNFLVNDTTAVDSFEVWANGTLLGAFVYHPDSLPLYIPDFPWNGNIFNHIRVCTGNAPPCCRELQFLAPACLPFGPCEVTDIFVQTGACTSDSTYKLRVNFQATNPGDGNFVLWANGALVDTFPLTAVPLAFDSFPWSGNNVDLIKICISGATPDTVPCCREKEFHPPACLFPDSCEIVNVVVDPGNCDPASQTYSLTLNFEVKHATNDFFELWAGNGQYLGYFPLSQLPLTIPAFPCTNSGTGLLKICINDNPDCCTTVDFQAPDCCNATGPCEIFDLTVETGDCTSDSTYHTWINFQVSNPLGDQFSVWTNGDFYGTFDLDSLPLEIPNFPWNGGSNDVVKICFISPDGAIGCCKTKEFAVPDCIDQPCEIYNLVVNPGDCTGDSTYSVTIKFQVDNPPGNIFGVWANGEFLGTFNLNQLPLTIDDFPWNGGANDVVKVCFVSPNDPAGSATCCRVKEFEVPDCLNQGGPCEIWDLTVTTGDCTGDSTYVVKINFSVANPPGNTFGVWANGVFFGDYNLNQLPLSITNFPWNGGANDVIKVCMAPNSNTGCCQTKEFNVPACLNQGGPCEVFDMSVQTGDCTGDSTYSVTIDFQVANAPGNTFGVWANGGFLGTYNVNQLPLTIDDFPWNGGQNDVVKVCFLSPNGAYVCCRTKEFAVPDCLDPGGPCDIHDLVVDTGDCTGDSTYQVWINFQVANPPGDQFGLWANGEFLGFFNLNQLPLSITDFPWNGGANDVVKVCFANSGTVGCCEIKEFAVPDCLNQGGPCEIYDLGVDTGDCTGDSTYQVWINFSVDNPPGNTFGVWANGQFLGTFNLNQLPLAIMDFPWNGGSNDVVKVCFVDPDHPDLPPTCCRTKEFAVPDCLDQGGPCEIYDLVVDPGDCTGDSTYSVLINFSVDNPTGNIFGVWANGAFIGTFNLSQLPLTISNFPWNGGPNDVVKICFVDPNNPAGSATCCRTKEFAVPDCLDQGGPCEIFNLVVDTGDCTGDSTYSVLINFSVDNPPGNTFGVWANGAFFGTFNLNQLPLTINNFPWNGGSNDVVKVCFVDPNDPAGSATCCRTKEFEVPDCLTQDVCHIFDLIAIPTPCLCGQFFVAISFQHENGGAGGFEIVGNGTNYGSFPYNTLQPIILGPLMGDGTTQYEFAVNDVQHPDCGDDVAIGSIDCMTSVVDPGGDAQLVLSPNPASNWLNVSAQLQGSAQIGESTVDIYHADGRLVRNFTVPDGGNFQIDVADLPAGVYRLSLQAAAGRLEGIFAKQ
ncbi:MAG: T9SS type A sorting domain-containing protein [Lewinellaceae bacterium]|nr:T9SS type A sorting domain-containing protein [Lewinellaceae bacterium]